MNTLTTNTQTTTSFEKSADEIVEILDQLGFDTETPVAEGYVKKLIVATLQTNLLGNTNYNIVPPTGIPPDDLGYPRFFSCESNKVKS